MVQPSCGCRSLIVCFLSLGTFAMGNVVHYAGKVVGMLLFSIDASKYMVDS